MRNDRLLEAEPKSVVPEPSKVVSNMAVLSIRTSPVAPTPAEMSYFEPAPSGRSQRKDTKRGEEVKRVFLVSHILCFFSAAILKDKHCIRG